MSKTSSNLPVCVYCGTPRPADETLCPKCGKPWIDTTIENPVPVAASLEDNDSEDTQDMPIIPVVPPVEPQEPPPITPEANSGDQDDVVVPPPPLLPDDDEDFSFDDWTEEPAETRRSAAVWLIPLVLAVAAAVVWVVVFIDSPSTPVSTTVEAAPTTTEQATTTTVAAASGNTEQTTTTAAAAPVPPTIAPPSDWAPLGEALAADEFAMKAAGVGPLTFGMPIEEVAGLLGASFGEAIASGADRVCPPQETYWLQWGDLMVIFDGADPGASFVSYRNEVSDVSGAALGFATLSGLKLGDTVADLRSTYPSYTISFERVDSTTVFRLLEGGDLLLWGPLSNPDADGVIEGIFSPSPCPSE